MSAPSIPAAPGEELFVLLVTYRDAGRFEALLDDHRDWLRRKFEQGVFVVSGGLSEADGIPNKRAFALFKAPDFAAAQALMAQEPFFRGGACVHEILRFNPRFHAEPFDPIHRGAMSTLVPRKP